LFPVPHDTRLTNGNPTLLSRTPTPALTPCPRRFSLNKTLTSLGDIGRQANPRIPDCKHSASFCRETLKALYQKIHHAPAGVENERSQLCILSWDYFLEVALIPVICSSFTTCLTLGTDEANCSISCLLFMLSTSPLSVRTPFLAAYLMS
jgi:hypothetical protein